MKKNDLVSLNGNVKIYLKDKNGKLKDFREVKNTVVVLGDAYVADQLSDRGVTRMGWMAIGSGTTAVTTTDTALVTEVDRNALTGSYGIQGSGSDDNDVVFTGDWAAGDGTGTITEAGIFNASSDGTMLARTVFSAVTKAAADTLQIVWTITCGAS